MVWRGQRTGPEWSRESEKLDEISFPWRGESVSVGQMLERTMTDGMVVLRRGKLVYESYHAGLEPHIPHVLFSVSKSVAGMLAGVLVGRGLLDPDRPIVDYLPEVQGSGYADVNRPGFSGDSLA
jgi:CubicO group peptidase (beta-lactamase class C family)